MPATTGWAKWATTTTESDPLILTKETTVTVSLTGTALNSYWGSVDNIVIYEWKAAAKHTFDDLTALISKVPADYKTMGFTDKSVAAVTAAADAAKALTASSPSADIDAAYEALHTALGKLIFKADIFVEKIANYDEENNIRGVDVSSYLSLMDSFEEVNKTITDEKKKRGFRDWNGKLLDKQGFFNLLAASGINYVRTRVWNDPYTSDHKGYGGGNNDLDKAVEMGKYATKAGMRNLIDFHFSDFWADPAKQKAPKAWENYTVEERATAISEYVTSALTRFKNEGVDVGMIQIGNETTSKFCSPSNNS